MKLPARSFRVFWDVHAWGGALLGACLAAMFLLGAFALFWEEIALWEDPALVSRQRSTTAADLARVYDVITRRHGVDVADYVAVDEARVPHSAVRVRIRRAGDEEQVLFVDPHSLRETEERSVVGKLLLELHYLTTSFAEGTKMAGVLSLLLLVVVASGVLIHLKDLVRAFWRFRPDAERRRAFADAHTLLGLFTLPFVVMLAWSGAVVALSYDYAHPAFRRLLFQGDAPSLSAALGLYAVTEPKQGPAPSRPSMPALVDVGEQAVPNVDMSILYVENVGDASEQVTLWGQPDDVFNGWSQAQVRARDRHVHIAFHARDRPPASGFQEWLYGLHFAQFGGAWLKLLYALLALFACAVIVTGTVLWLQGPGAASSARLDGALARTTVASTAGLALAIGALFCASRLAPLAFPWRASTEEGVFYASWLGTLVFALRATDVRRCTLELLRGAGACFLAAPLLGVIVGPSPSTLAFAFEGIFIPLAVDGGLLFVGTVLLVVYALGNRHRLSPGRRAASTGPEQLSPGRTRE